MGKKCMLYWDKRNTMVPVPPISKLVSVRNKKASFLLKNGKIFEISESCVSIKMLLTAYRFQKKSECITICLPELFCGETVEKFKDVHTNIIYYPVDRQLNPKWNDVEKIYRIRPFDFFLQVHYFGIIYDMKISREFCTKNEVIFIEDCTHLLPCAGEFIERGDFIIYSPHKQLGLRDGALLKCNPQTFTANELLKKIEEQYQIMKRRKNDMLWIIKKIIQNITHIAVSEKKYKIPFKVRYFQKECIPAEMEKISRYSLAVINSYSEREFDNIVQKRKENLYIISSYVEEICKGAVQSFMVSKQKVPYLAVFILNNPKEKEAVRQKLQKSGMIISYWPDMCNEVNNINSDAYWFAQNSFVIPIHQQIKIREEKEKC